MYSTCTFCHAALGKNEALEHFPVGRRVAIDQSHGRLWAVCAACGQWNLSPIETRWEAIEEGERLYRDTRLRASTDQIGLARLRDGTELIRIGEPLRPEFAAWRYGKRFAQRWRVSGRVAAVAGVGVWATKVAGPFISTVAAAPFLGLLALASASTIVTRRGTAAWVRLPEVGRVRLTHAHALHLQVQRDPDAGGGWSLRLPYEPRHVAARMARADDPVASVQGADARMILAAVMPRINRGGGRKSDVDDAVRSLEASGSVDRVLRLATAFTKAARDAQRLDDEVGAADPFGPPSSGEEEASLARVPTHVRLAVEMALHEDVERRALQGELAELEQRWREAEEIAAIADELTLPERITKRLERLIEGR